MVRSDSQILPVTTHTLSLSRDIPANGGLEPSGVELQPHSESRSGEPSWPPASLFETRDDTTSCPDVVSDVTM